MPRSQASNEPDRLADALGRIADILDREVEARQSERSEAANSRRREGIAIIVIAITAIFTSLAYTNSAGAIAHYLEPLRDYEALAAAVLTVFVAMAYRAFQVGLIPIEIFVAVAVGELAVAVMTFWSAPSIRDSPYGPFIPIAFTTVALMAILFTEPHANAFLAGSLSAMVAVGMLLLAGLLVISHHGTEWLRIAFVGQTLLLIDSAFPLLLLLDIVASFVIGLAFVVGCSQRHAISRAVGLAAGRLGLGTKWRYVVDHWSAGDPELEQEIAETGQVLAGLPSRFRIMSHRVVNFVGIGPTMAPLGARLGFQAEDFDSVAILTAVVIVYAFVSLMQSNPFDGIAHYFSH